MPFVSMKRRRAFLFCLGLTLACASSFPFAFAARASVPLLPIPEPDPVVEFPDPALRRWVEDRLRIVPGATVRMSDIERYCRRMKDEGVTRLTLASVSDAKIRSLEGIQAFAGCEFRELVATGQDIEDIAPLTALRTLETIGASDNRLSDVRAFGAFDRLTSLAVRNNRIRSLDGLERLTQMRHADFSSNDLADLEAVRHWTGLKTLAVSDNPIGSLAPLAGLTGLTQLRMSMLKLGSDAELEHLRALTALDYLDASSNALEDVAPIGGLTSLRVLYLHDNRISDVAPIASLANLERLYVSENRIRDLAPLAPLEKLTTLSAEHNWISSLEPVQHLPLATAGFGYNRIDQAAAHNLPAVVRWLTLGTTIDLSHQDVNKAYPYADETETPGDAGDSGDSGGSGGSGDVGGSDGSGGSSDSGDPSAPGDAGGSGDAGGVVFSDIEGHWAEADIRWAIERGMVNGVGAGRFQPDGTTTEEQFLKMLLIAMGALTEEPVSDPWSRKYYDFALDYGYPVHPEERGNPVARTDVAELIAATQGERLDGDDAIAYMLEKGLSNGKTAPTIEGYRGEDALTRAEAVRFIRNVLDRAEHPTPQRAS